VLLVGEEERNGGGACDVGDFVGNALNRPWGGATTLVMLRAKVVADESIEENPGSTREERRWSPGHLCLA